MAGRIVAVLVLLSAKPACGRVGSIGRQLHQALANDVASSLLDGRTKGGLHDVAASASQQPVASSTVSSKGYFERVAESFFTALLGLMGFIFSIPVLWINERRNARMECTILQGKSDCVPVTTAKEDNRGRLVHIEGEETRQAAPVADETFVDVLLEASCIRLRTIIEIYQWVEHSETKKEERLGGTETTTTLYTYTQEWTSSWNDSSRYNNPSGHENTKPAGLDPCSSTTNCSRVEYAAGFLLPDDLVNQLGTFEPAGELLGSTIRTAIGGHTLHQNDAGGWYCLREHAPSTAPAEVVRSPQIGDARVRFEVVKPGTATVLALQAESKSGEALDTLLPYRLVSKGFCGLLSEEEVKRRRIEQGRRSASQMAEDDDCSCGPFTLCCCACNCVNWCMAATLQPELFHCFQGNMGRSACFRVVEQNNKLATWLCRVAGWLLMFWGLYAMFAPVIALLAVIPFVKSLGAAAIWVVCLLVTLVFASLIVFLAYLAYHPLLAFGAVLVVALAAATPKLVGLALAAK